MIIGAPDLIVEILSPSSIFMDLAIKYQKYRKAGVKEYWIINPDDKCIIDFKGVCEDFDMVYPEMVAEIESEEYYVNMMR